MSIFGHTLRAARKASGLTLKDIEAATGQHNGYLSQLETGRIKNPSIQMINKLADAYGIPRQTLINLLDGSTSPEQQEPVSPTLILPTGLTKREWFAGLALQGLLAGDPQMSYSVAAESAVDHAEFLIRELAHSAVPAEQK